MYALFGVIITTIWYDLHTNYTESEGVVETNQETVEEKNEKAQEQFTRKYIDHFTISIILENPTACVNEGKVYTGGLVFALCNLG